MLDAAPLPPYSTVAGFQERAFQENYGGVNCIFNPSVSRTASLGLLAEAVTKANLDLREEDTDSIILIAGVARF